MRQLWQTSTVFALLIGFCLVIGCGQPPTAPAIDPEKQAQGVRPKPGETKKGAPPIVKD